MAKHQGGTGVRFARIEVKLCRATYSHVSSFRKKSRFLALGVSSTTTTTTTTMRNEEPDTDDGIGKINYEYMQCTRCTNITA